MKTMNIRSTLTRMTALVLMMIALLCSVIPAEAANVCTSISGNWNRTVTFTVKTDKCWLTRNKVTLTQTKGSCSYYVPFFVLFELYSGGEQYGYYTVTVKDSGGKKVYEKNWYNKTLNITGLKGNSTYTITVKPAKMFTDKEHSDLEFIKWSRVATWRVSKTGGIKLCR